MAKLVAYLSFDGNCREAMDFYKEALGGELTMQIVGESPMAEQMPAEMKTRIMHSQLSNGDLLLFASDMMASQAVVRGNSVTLCIAGKNKQEIEGYFSKLSQGANVTHPLKEEFFGTYGDLTDKFGVNWMFQAG